MGFHTKKEAVDASLGRRMEVAYATINRQLEKPEHVRYINNPEQKDPYTEVTFSDTADDAFLARIRSELESAGWHRVAFKTSPSSHTITVRFYREAGDVPETPEEPEEPPVDPEVPEEPGVVLPDYLKDVELTVGDVNAKGQTSDGKLISGSGNAVSEFSLASNGEIELALAVRRYRSGAAFAPVDGVYSIELTDTADWTWPFSIALLEEARPITELYDVVLTLDAKGTGASVPFTLTRDDAGVYHFINEEHELDIKDSTSSESGDVVQNIQRVKFYEALMGDIEKNGGGAALGEYAISLRAVRKEGDVAPVELTVNAVATAAAA